MKRYCKCGEEVDEVEFEATGSCYYCNRTKEFIENIKEVKER